MIINKGAYVQFRGSEFHTRNARFRQPQEQRRAKAGFSPTLFLQFMGKGDVYDFMLFFNPYIEIFLQEIKTFREKHKIIDVPFLPSSKNRDQTYCRN